MNISLLLCDLYMFKEIGSIAETASLGLDHFSVGCKAVVTKKR